jgi:hypothetical protein
LLAKSASASCPAQLFGKILIASTIHYGVQSKLGWS